MHNTTYVPNWRQHIMRALFFLNFIALAPDNFATIMTSNGQLDIMTGVAFSLYAALGLLCIFGVRFPLKFIPLLLMQLIYKSTWLLGIYLPVRNSDIPPNEDMESWLWVMAPGIIIDILVIPWKYVYVEYLRDFFQLRIKES